MSHSPARLFPLGSDATPYRKLSSDGVRVERRWAARFWSSGARR